VSFLREREEEPPMERIFSTIAKEQPERMAVTCGADTMTFGELDRYVTIVGNRLRKLGMEEGDRFCIMAKNSVQWYAMLMVADKFGFSLVPLNYRYKFDEVNYIIGDSDAKSLFIDEERVDVFQDRLDEMPEAVKGRVFCISGEEVQGDWFRPFSSLLEDPDDVEPEDIPHVHGATLMNYTSGTTGRPKGVLRSGMSKDVVLAMREYLAEFWGYRPEDTHGVFGALYHGAPMMHAYINTAMGASVVILPVAKGFKAEEALQMIQEHRIHTAHMVPAMFIRILELPEETRRKYDMSSLRRVMHAAAPCPIDVKWKILDYFGKGVVWEYYGGSEGGGTMITDEEWRQRPGSVGKAWPMAEIRIYDEEGNPLPPNETGIIYMRAGSFGFEYHKDAKKTEKAYIEGFFTMGDMGYLDEEGYLFIVDRKSDMILSGGVNIYPAEIENVIFEHPAVLDVAVFGVPDEKWGEAIKAVVQIKVGQTATAEEILEWCEARLSKIKKPKSVDFMDELPRDINGKIYKRQLRDQYWESRSTKVI
jgi:long-chain acyl-CoA synthetase